MGLSVWLWSTTAADNATADPNINYAEGQSPGSLNNSARAVMAAIARFRRDQGGALTTGGSATAYTVATNQVLGTLADGVMIHVVAHASNTGAATLNVDSLGAKAIRRMTASGDAAIAAGALVANGHYLLAYDASANSAAGAWIVLNPEPVSSGTVTVSGLVVGSPTGGDKGAGAINIQSLYINGTLQSPASTATTITGGGLADGGGSLAASRVITVTAASQAQAQAGTDNTTAMTPLRTAQAIAALAPGGGQPVPSAWNDFAVGTLLLLRVPSGSVNNNAAVSGSGLRMYNGAAGDSGLTGTWKNVHGFTVTSGTGKDHGYFVRTA